MIAVTRIGIVIFIAGLLLFDLMMLLIGGDRATVSAVAYNLAKEHPVVAFAVGFCMGHLFWPQNEKTRGEKK